MQYYSCSAGDKDSESELTSSSDHQYAQVVKKKPPAQSSPKASPSHRKSATPPKVSPKPSPITGRKPSRSGSGSPGGQRRELTNSTGTVLQYSTGRSIISV